MNRMKALLPVLSLVLASGASAEIVQVWECNLRDGKTQAELTEASAAWTAAAKKQKGGGELNISLEFPLAAEAGPGGFNFVLIAPDAATWGTFNDNYEGSAAQAADRAWDEVATCSGAALYNSIDIE